MGSCLNLPHAAQIVKLCSFVFLHLQKTKVLRTFFVFARILTFDRFVLFYILVVSHSAPSTPLLMADGVPVLIHERWLPSFVFHMRGVNERAQCTFFICSPAPSRNTASEKSVVNFGFTTFFDSMFFPISTAARSSTEMNFSSPSIILSRLFCCKPCTTISTGLSPSFCWFAKSLSAWIKLPQTLFGAACARNTFASRRFMLSCTTKILFGAFQSYWPPQAAHHQLHCLFPCPDEIHHM